MLEEIKKVESKFTEGPFKRSIKVYNEWEAKKDEGKEKKYLKAKFFICLNTEIEFSLC